jgi:hypothetical protein
MTTEKQGGQWFATMAHKSCFWLTNLIMCPSSKSDSKYNSTVYVLYVNLKIFVYRI